ncbi:hypothetical protein OSH11_13885 [Kaistia dalseonensis]|uniref:Uncharacterized protein n=1 Tax=Kaistia dalseonensis TaxID=410840 RepID=A0ABU0HAA8_9HYPH|nr:hypothetical protein [Kaistia dalseonensis]MCX5495800.1 hypothetical protein [Kaistia dalseonensis]MDQ0438401.1 hypothetical protein [Kaistia dalseonensis]
MAFIKQLALSRTIWIAAALLIGYWPVALLFSGPGLIEVLNGALLGVSTAVLIAYLPEALRAAAKPRLDKTDQLILGIVVTWIGTDLFRAWGIYSRVAGFPEWMRYSPMLGFLIYLFILGGVLHITAPNSIADHVPRAAWIRVGAAIGVGAFIAGLIVGSRVAVPALQPFLGR